MVELLDGEAGGRVLLSPTASDIRLVLLALVKVSRQLTVVKCVRLAHLNHVLHFESFEFAIFGLFFP